MTRYDDAIKHEKNAVDHFTQKNKEHAVELEKARKEAEKTEKSVEVGTRLFGLAVKQLRDFLFWTNQHLKKSKSSLSVNTSSDNSNRIDVEMSVQVGGGAGRGSGCLKLTLNSTVSTRVSDAPCLPPRNWSHQLVW